MAGLRTKVNLDTIDVLSVLQAAFYDIYILGPFVGSAQIDWLSTKRSFSTMCLLSSSAFLKWLLFSQQPKMLPAKVHVFSLLGFSFF